MHRQLYKTKALYTLFFYCFRRNITKNNQIKLLYMDFTAYFCSVITKIRKI